MILGFDAKRAFHNRTGLGNYSRDVLRVLARHHPEHRYLAYNPRAGGVAWELPAGGRVEERRPRGALGRALPALWRRSGIAADVAADGVEVFHGLSNELPAGIERSGAGTVVTIHDLIFERFPELYRPVDRRIYRWKFRDAAERADRVVAVSEATRRDLVALYGIDDAKIRVVHQGCHPVFSTDPAPERIDAVRRELALPDVFVLQVGTIERRKNLLLTVRAIAQVPGATLVAVGRATAYAAEVRAEAERLGVADRVRLLHGVGLDALHVLYRLATVAVYPSRVEGFGIPVVEALAAGTPAVTTRGAPFDEAGGDAAVYVDPDDADALAAVLAALLGDPARREAMRAAGLRHVERFADATIAAGLVAVYLEARR